MMYVVKVNKKSMSYEREHCNRHMLLFVCIQILKQSSSFIPMVLFWSYSKCIKEHLENSVRCHSSASVRDNSFLERLSIVHSFTNKFEHWQYLIYLDRWSKELWKHTQNHFINQIHGSNAEQTIWSLLADCASVAWVVVYLFRLLLYITSNTYQSRT